MSEESTPREDEKEDLVSVREVPDEATATMLRDFLVEQGIEATLVSTQMPWFGTIEAPRRGSWGRVQVLERDAAQARALIDDFYAARPEADATSPPESGGERG